MLMHCRHSYILLSNVLIWQLSRKYLDNNLISVIHYVKCIIWSTVFQWFLMVGDTLYDFLDTLLICTIYSYYLVQSLCFWLDESGIDMPDKYDWQLWHRNPKNKISNSLWLTLVLRMTRWSYGLIPLSLTPWVPAALAMQGLVDVGRMGCSSPPSPFPRSPFSRHLPIKRETPCHSEPLTTAFHPGYPSLN